VFYPKFIRYIFSWFFAKSISVYHSVFSVSSILHM